MLLEMASLTDLGLDNWLGWPTTEPQRSLISSSPMLGLEVGSPTPSPGMLGPT